MQIMCEPAHHEYMSLGTKRRKLGQESIMFFFLLRFLVGFDQETGKRIPHVASYCTGRSVHMHPHLLPLGQVYSDHICTLAAAFLGERIAPSISLAVHQDAEVEVSRRNGHAVGEKDVEAGDGGREDSGHGVESAADVDLRRVVHHRAIRGHIKGVVAVKCDKGNLRLGGFWILKIKKNGQTEELYCMDSEHL